MTDLCVFTHMHVDYAIKMKHLTCKPAGINNVPISNK
jgi:hypothetical protein